MAVARDPGGRLELFLVGDRLQATLSHVADNMQFQEWTAVNDVRLPANRLLLPSDSYFSSAAAFICTELIEAEYSTKHQVAFSRVEPLISMLLRRVELGDNVLLGVIGELSLLDALTRLAPPEEVAELVQAWKGFAPSARDFQIRRVGVEVKTTISDVSVHHIQGFHQVELGHAIDGVPEEKLYLLSLGFAAVPESTQGGISVPSLVDLISARVESDQVRTGFTARVRQYGGDAAIGYDHTTDRDRPRFSRRLVPMFERLYDLADERLKILRRADVQSYTNVDADSLEFRIDLPSQVTGELNPITGMRSIATALLNSSQQG